MMFIQCLLISEEMLTLWTDELFYGQLPSVLPWDKHKLRTDNREKMFFG